ncbi:MAG: hypothetical protein IJV33_00235 [Bacteroidaceae bacterium]|nr:hypothetical protein [Bacteroidaceae bacterium]
MILFVFEGEKREPDLFRTLQRLYFPRDNETIVCSFGNNIYELYQELEDYGEDGDIVAIMKERLVDKEDNPLAAIDRSSDFSEIYLFFDYDFQHKYLSLEVINSQVAEMLSMFNDETDRGKLYINYPMIESIRYTKELPDASYQTYVVTREECCDFKALCDDFSAYPSLDFILLKDEKPTKEKYLSVRDNWEYLKEQNVKKANHICCGTLAYPLTKAVISQDAIFQNQLSKFVNTDTQEVSILNAFPLFLYEYFK